MENYKHVKKFLITHKAQLVIGSILLWILVMGLIKSINQGNTTLVIITIVAIGMLIYGVVGKIKSKTAVYHCSAKINAGVM